MIEAAARVEVKAGGLLWRVVRVCSEDVRKRRQIMLLAVMPRSAEDAMQEEQVRAMPDEKERLAALIMLRIERQKKNLTPEHAAQAQATRPAILMTGVEAVSSDEGLTWAPISLVVDEAEQDPAATPPRVWQGRLTPQTAADLFNAIWSLSTDEGAAIERIERFRRGTEHAAADAQDREVLRGASPHAADAVA